MNAVAASVEQGRLLEAPMIALNPVSIDQANNLLVGWGHRLGAVHRPYTQQGFVLELDGRSISVATSGSIVSNHVAGYHRTELVECTRLCTAPGYACLGHTGDASRVA